MESSFGTNEGVFTDLNGTSFPIEHYERIDATSYRFEVTNFVEPVLGAGTLEWQAFAFSAPNVVSVTSVSAVGSIQTDVAAAYTDGQSFTLIDTQGGVEQFEFDTTGDGVAIGSRAVNLASATTADEVRNAIISAVNGADDVEITATSGGAATVTLTQDIGGSKGNREIVVTGSPPGIYTDFSGGSGNVTDLGRQSIGYSGRRYRIVGNFTDPPIAGIGNWAFIDSEGVISYLETFQPSSSPGGNYEFEIVSDTQPAPGNANIFLVCEVVTNCDFCRASSIFVRISPTTILNFPEALEGDALGRLIIRLQQMIPAHVRIAAFVFDPGPAIADWGTISALSEIQEFPSDDALWTAFYDEDEFPADEIPADSAPIVATSEVTITNENVMEEYIDGSDPLVSGTWTAAGLWHVTEYRSSTQYRSFNYGQNDVGRLGDVGSVPPDYNGVADGVVHRLTSPTFILSDTGASGETITLRLRHYGDLRSSASDVAGDDLVRIELYRTGPTLVTTIGKTELGLLSGSNGSFTTFEKDISASVINTDTYWLEFVYDEGTVAGVPAGTGEGWYIDDIEVQVTPP